ncbi:MAG: DUF5990 family protein [Anaerolineae bacterium]|nr:DUF5990 family protein [Anaerolineae bacterium]
MGEIVEKQAIRIICLNPIDCEHEGKTAMFGLQDKTPTLQAGASRPDGGLEFTCEITVKQADDKVDFAGNYVHGSKGERFLYLSWGVRHETGWYWIRRIKIMLGGITSAQVQIARNAVLAATIDVAGSGARALFIGEGWHIG